jgi:type II secretory pathway component GspD/PulD (secretin)
MITHLFPRSLLAASFLAVIAAASFGQALDPTDEGGNTFRKLPPEMEAKAAELRAAPPQQYDFNKSNLGDVLRFLATDAKLSFISLPEDAEQASQVITFSINSSPFSVLETLCHAHGLSLFPEKNGMWFIRTADDRELIGRSYDVKYNTMEKIENNRRSGASGGGGTIQSASVDLQGAEETFKTLRSELINDIRAILDLPELDETGAPRSTTTTPAPTSSNISAAQMLAATNSSQLSMMHQPKVIWKSDSNTIYVVATRLQHLWVEGYLIAADKPQPMIAVEVKFIETSKDPTKELGIDWSGTLGTRGTHRQLQGLSWETEKKKDSNGVEYEVDIPKAVYNMAPNTEGGFRVDASRLDNMRSIIRHPISGTSGGLLDMGRIAASAAWPSSALLSAQDLNVKLRAMLNDQETQTVSYPRMVTLNNREVVIRSVVNQPVLDGTAAVASGGGGAVATTSITYLPIGTVLNILPKKMEGDQVLMNVKITMSSVIGEKMISGNSYPVATSRVYNAPVMVNQGYTVAIGGLDEAKEKSTATGVPLLGRIPGLKYLFSSKAREKNHKNLMLFITPTLIDPNDGGLPPEPISVVPQRPEKFMPKKPQVDVNGTIVGGSAAVEETVKYLTRECDKIKMEIDESRITPKTSEKLTDMYKALNKLDEKVTSIPAANPEEGIKLNQIAADSETLRARVAEMKKLALRKEYF